MSSTQATGRPTQPIPLLPRILLAAAGVLVLMELLLRAYLDGSLRRMPLWSAMAHQVLPALRRYYEVRRWVVRHPALTAFVCFLAVAVVLVLTRYWLLFWHNEVVARLSGTYLAAEQNTFPAHPVQLM